MLMLQHFSLTGGIHHTVRIEKCLLRHCLLVIIMLNHWQVSH
jgi:hypothetical protein